jgi:hypothetical protein
MDPCAVPSDAGRAHIGAHNSKADWQIGDFMNTSTLLFILAMVSLVASVALWILGFCYLPMALVFVAAVLLVGGGAATLEGQ